MGASTLVIEGHGDWATLKPKSVGGEVQSEYRGRHQNFITKRMEVYNTRSSWHVEPRVVGLLSRHAIHVRYCMHFELLGA